MIWHPLLIIREYDGWCLEGSSKSAGLFTNPFARWNCESFLRSVTPGRRSRKKPRPPGRPAMFRWVRWPRAETGLFRKWKEYIHQNLDGAWTPYTPPFFERGFKWWYIRFMNFQKWCWRGSFIGEMILLDIFPSFASTSANVQVELMFRCSKTKNAFVAWKRVIYNKTKTYYAPQLQNICRILLPHAVFMHFSQFNSWGLDHHFLFGGTSILGSKVHPFLSPPPFLKQTYWQKSLSEFKC